MMVCSMLRICWEMPPFEQTATMTVDSPNSQPVNINLLKKKNSSSKYYLIINIQY